MMSNAQMTRIQYILNNEVYTSVISEGVPRHGDNIILKDGLRYSVDSVLWMQSQMQYVEINISLVGDGQS